jgi:hypothetical protein
MEFRDPRILAPGHKELDKPIKTAAEFIVKMVDRFASGHDVPAGERMFWASLGEMRALDLIDAAFATSRDELDGVAGRTVAERERDVALARVNRDLEQFLRTSVQVAKERHKDQRRALFDAILLVHDQLRFLESWVGAEILPELPGEAGV